MLQSKHLYGSVCGLHTACQIIMEQASKAHHWLLIVAQQAALL
jgi:hypothetical protein